MNFSLACVSGEPGSCFPSLSAYSPCSPSLLLSVSQGWWCHSAGPHYWIRAISCTAWFSESNPISFSGTTGLRVVMCFLFCDGITGLLADAVNWSHFPLTVFLMILRECVTLNLHPRAFFRRKSAFRSSKKSWQKPNSWEALCQALSNTLAHDSHNNPRRGGTLFPLLHW